MLIKPTQSPVANTNESKKMKTMNILDAGNVENVAQFAENLRLSVTKEECSTVLNYISRKEMVGVGIDDVETAINELFGNRFVEP